MYKNVNFIKVIKKGFSCAIKVPFLLVIDLSFGFIQSLLPLFLGIIVGQVFMDNVLLRKPMDFVFFDGPIQSRIFFELTKTWHGSPQEMLWVVIVSVFLLTTLMGIMGLLGVFIAYLLKNKLINNLRIELYDKIMDIGLNTKNKKDSGEIIFRLQQDTEVIYEFYNNLIKGPWIHGTIFLSALYSMFAINKELALIVVSLPIVCLFFNFLIASYIRKYSRLYREKSSDLISKTEESIVHGKYIISYNNKHDEKKIYGKLSLSSLIASLKERIFYVFLVQLVQNICEYYKFILMAIGAGFIWEGSLSIGQWLAFVVFFNQAKIPLITFTRTWAKMQPTFVGMDRVVEVLDMDTEILDKEGVKLLEEISNDEIVIEGKNLDFKYDSEFSVLKDICFSAKSGQLVAIVGDGGAGKTTLINLLARFIDPDNGSIKINDNDIVNISLDYYRSIVSTSFQDGTLFTGTIEDNIKYGLPDLSKEDLIKYSKISCVDEFVGRFPKKYETYVGEMGENLSRSQKMRIVLARSLAKKSKIVLLDEVLDSVTKEQSKQIIKGLRKEEFKNRVFFIVTHRQDIIDELDKIINI